MHAEVGSDRELAATAAEAVKPHVERTYDDAVLESLSGIGAFYALPPKRWKKPLLVTAAGGVGAKLEFAHALGRHDTIGRDLVAVIVDKIVCSGAQPLLLLDYLAAARLDPAQAEAVVSGIADACEEAGCALAGGEMAAYPQVIAGDRYDLAGFGVGVVERAKALDADRPEAGDAVVAMASTGLHVEGYEVARRIVADAGLDLMDDHGLRVQSLGEALLRPSRIYAPACLALVGGAAVHAMCRVGSGGVAGSLRRILPEGLGAVVDAETFTSPGVFGLLADHGGLSPEEMWRVFNMGAGMLAVVVDGQRAVEVLRDRGIDAWVCGAVREGDDVRVGGIA